MKKGLLLAIGVSAGFSLAAQAPKVSGAKKADLMHSRTITTDGSSINFFAAANAAQRTSNPVTVQTQGVKFSSSYNAFTLLVSQSNCLIADQALNMVLFTHRISQDWAADANVSSGYGEYSWTTDCGATWDSTYYNDNTVLGNQRFRYPSGGLINPAGNTNIANAIMVTTGPWTDGSGWGGWYETYQNIMNGSTPTVNVQVPGFRVAFPRIDAQGCSDSTTHVSGELLTTPTGASPTGLIGMGMITGKWNGTSVSFTYDSIMPTFHTDGTGAPDAWGVAHTAWSADGAIGYVVFFGVLQGVTTPTMRGYTPIVYKTTDHGANWAMLPQYDYSTIPAIANNPFIYPASDGQLHPWFSQSMGSDVAVDNNGQLHIFACIEGGSSNHDDSLGYAWTLTGQNGLTGRHYMYDTYTTANTWNSVLVDSLMCTSSDNTTIFVDGSNSGAAFPTDARIQISSNSTRDHLFYLWTDTDPFATQAENALPDLFGKAVDLTTGDWTNTKNFFPNTQDFYFQFVSSTTLFNGVDTYTIPVTNSIDRNNSHDVATTFDHYYVCGVTFSTSEFVGVEEHNADFGTFSTTPNPAHDMFNINLDLVKSSSVTITIMNSVGQAVKVETRDLNKGQNHIQINSSDLSAGIYFVNIASDNSSSTAKIIIE